MRIKRIIFFIIIMIFLLSIFKGVEYVSMPARAIKKINEECYDIKIDLNEKVVIADDKEIALEDFLGLSKKKLDKMVEDDSINKYIEENLIGNVKSDDGKISVFNPFSTSGLSIEVKNDVTEDFLKEYDTITKYKKVLDKRYTLNFENAVDTKNAYNKLKDDSRVDKVVYNYKIFLKEEKTENVNEKTVRGGMLAWGVTSTGLDTYSKKLNNSEGTNAVIVAVLDSGIRGTHEVFNIPEAPGKVDYSLSYDYGDDDDDITDEMGHGTIVAGVVAEATSNNVSIVPVKILDNEGNGNFDDILDALSDIGEEVDVVNMSLGVNVTDLTDEEEFQVICDYYDEFLKVLRDDFGLVMVCAAGNDGNDVDYPACSQYTLAASSINDANEISDFSCYGNEVDFALPGENVITPNHYSDSGYSMSSGTSISTPFLSSAVAQIMCEYGTDIDRDELIDILIDNAEDLGNTGKDPYYGYGSINFNETKFSTPEFLDVSVDSDAWGTKKDVSFKAISGKKLTNYALSTDDTEPEVWQAIAKHETYYEDVVEANENGTHYIWIKDESGSTAVENIDITRVDNENPIINTITWLGSTTDSFSIKIAVTDNLSGVSKINWYYKKKTDSTYLRQTEMCEEGGEGLTGTFSKIGVFSNLESGTEYAIIIDVYDMVGNTVRAGAFYVTTEENGKNIQITNYTNGNARVSVGNDSSSTNGTFSTIEDTIRVTCENACVVLHKTGENEYEVLNAIETGSSTDYDFNIGNIQGDNIEIVVALRGDVNLSGNINLVDAIMIRRSRLSTTHEQYVELSELQNKVADANKSGSVNMTDALAIRKSRLSENSGYYAKIEW